MNDDEYNKATDLEKILYDCTGMLASNHSGIVDAMVKYAKVVKEKCNLPVVMESQFEAYAAFCIECDRQGMKPIKYKDYLEIG